MGRATTISLLMGAILLLAFSCTPSKIVPVGQAQPCVDQPPPACAAYEAPRIAARIQSEKLQEISGIAISRKNPNLLWVQNDSGDGPFLYGVSLTGQLLGSIKLPDTRAWDWEDMAIGPCGSKECFYIGDIGDNQRVRAGYTIYRVPVPDMDPPRPFGVLYAEKVERFLIQYPGGSRNAEALAVRADGSILILTKEKGESTLFAFDLLKQAMGEPIAVLRLGSAHGAKVTAADMHPNGDRLLFRTYDGAFEYFPGRAKDPVPVPAAREEQGEAIAYDPVRGGYWHVSEGYLPYLYYVGCRSANGRTP